MAHASVYGNLILLMSYGRYALIFLFCLQCSSSLFAKPVVANSLPSKEVVKEYLKLHRNFRRKTCSPKIVARFEKLFAHNRMYGLYVPMLGKMVDTATIRHFLPELKRKIRWIKRQRTRSLTIANWTRANSKINKLGRIIKQLIKIKGDTLLSKPNSKQITRSQPLMQQLTKEYQLLLKSIPFLKSFRAPVNHTLMRKKYDYHRQFASTTHRKKANHIFFARKMLEDGASNPKTQKGDRYVRTVLNTILFELKNSDATLSENLRYDLEYLLGKLQTTLQEGKGEVALRLKAWQAQTEEMVKNYQIILRSSRNNPTSTARRYLKGKKNASERLKKFSLKYQSRSYRYWSKQSELYRALYTLETIIFNEVGTIDHPYNLERRDVGKVVINRRFMKKYSRLSSKDSIFYYLPKKSRKRVNRYPWLNLLFKEGEFSFTYYYIPSNLHIFCPSTDSRSKRIRHANLSLALKLLKKRDRSFKGIRYFSRVSMVGRVDMSTIWKGYRKIAERPGVKLKVDKRLSKRLRRGDGEVLYHFNDPKKRVYQVIRINHNTYVRPITRLDRLYSYRNPHVFTYFAQR